MTRERLTLTGSALLMSLASVLPARAAGAGGRPSFSGTYVFVPQRSDDLEAKVAAAVGPDSTVGRNESEPARVWIRSWLGGLTKDQAKRILTIEHTASEFKSDTGDEVDIYYFGREATSRGPVGGNLKVTVVWKGDQIVTEEKEVKGKGRMTAVYTLQPGGKALHVDWRLEHGSLRRPLEVRLAFDRALE